MCAAKGTTESGQGPTEKSRVGRRCLASGQPPGADQPWRSGQLLALCQIETHAPQQLTCSAATPLAARLITTEFVGRSPKYQALAAFSLPLQERQHFPVEVGRIVPMNLVGGLGYGDALGAGQAGLKPVEHE